MTLLRWLDLKSDEHLELERGEDIDRVRALISDSADATVERVFEAVKYRESNLTLRSEEALEALANYREHLDNNPGRKLLFRYITNCEVGCERPAITTEGIPGIHIWQRVRSDSRPKDEALHDATVLRDWLKQTTRPSGLSEATWDGLHVFLESATNERFLTFVRSFEWSAKNPSALNMRDEVLDKLAGKLSGTEIAQRYYDHLFVEVFKLLSHSGPKVLTEAGLSSALALVGPSPDVESIMRRLASLESQLRDVETAHSLLEDQSAKLDRILAGVGKLAPPPGMASVVYTADLAPMLDVPPPEPAISARVLIVDRLTRYFDSTVWFALYGGIGAGKTQLAVQVVGRLGGRVIWVRLRGLQNSAAAHTLDLALSTVCKCGPTVYLSELYNSACEILGRGSLIVIDDLPATSGKDRLSERLALLAPLCAVNGVRLITISGDALPPIFASKIGSKLLREQSAPPLEETEIQETLLAQGCPSEALTAAHVRTLRVFSHGHPVLVGALARFLAARQWRLDEFLLIELLAGKFSADLTASVQDWLLETVSEEAARTLLYRLRLIWAPFTDTHVAVVSSVAPEITLPMERLRWLTGLWVQRDGQSSYVVSPLVSCLPNENLSDETVRNIHSVLAKDVVKKGTLGPMDVFQAVVHFVAAERYDAAAFFLLLALEKIARTPDQVPEDFGLTSIWAHNKLPAEIELQKRIYLRGAQTVIQLRRSEDASYQLADLEALIRVAGTEEADAVAVASGTVSIWLGKTDPIRASRLILSAQLVQRTATPPQASPQEFNARSGLLQTLGLMPTWITSVDQAHEWLDVIEQLGPTERSGLYAHRYSARALEVMVTNLWLPAAKHSTGEEDLARIIADLKDVADRSQKAGVIRLFVESRRALIAITASYKSNLASAMQIAESTLAEAAAIDPLTNFIICDTVARQLFYAGRLDESLPWWRRALAAQGEADDDLRVSSITVAGATAASVGDVAARGYLEEAASLAVTVSGIHWLTRFRALGEYGIFLWQAGDRKQAYEPWSRAIDLLRENRDDSSDWKTVFRISGNCASYFAHQLKRDITDWKYAIPAPGILLQTPQEALVISYRPSQEWLLAANMAEFAWTVSQYRDADRWASDALEGGARVSAQDVLYLGIRPMLWIHRIPELLGRKAFLEIVEAAVQFTMTFSEITGSEPLTEEERLRARVAIPGVSGLAARMMICAVGLEIIRLSLHDSDQAAALGRTLAGRCQAAADTSTDPQMWTASAEFFAQFARAKEWRELYDAGVSLANSANFLLGTLYYLHAAILAEPVKAFQLHMAVLGALEQHVSQHRSPSRELYPLLLPALVIEVWKLKVEETPFYFGLLPSLRREFAAIYSRPVTVSLMKILLRSVSLSLNVQLEPEGRLWLNADGNGGLDQQI